MIPPKLDNPLAINNFALRAKRNFSLGFLNAETWALTHALPDRELPARSYAHMNALNHEASRRLAVPKSLKAVDNSRSDEARLGNGPQFSHD